VMIAISTRNDVLNVTEHARAVSSQV
jgi:hypothetical protein